MHRLGLALLLWAAGPEPLYVDIAGRGAGQTRLTEVAAIGDNGTGSRAQYDIGQQMVDARARFPFELVIMLGDNMYGRQEPEDSSRSSRGRMRGCCRPASASTPRSAITTPGQHAVRRVPHGRGALLHIRQEERALLRPWTAT